MDYIKALEVMNAVNQSKEICFQGIARFQTDDYSNALNLIVPNPYCQFRSRTKEFQTIAVAFDVEKGKYE